MSVTFSHSFGDHQHPTYLGRAGGLAYSLSASCGHLEDHSAHSSHPHHHPTASDSLASAVPFILYPSGCMDPSAALSLYEGAGPFRGSGGGPHTHHHHHHPGAHLLPYLSPFHHHAGRFGGVYECPFEPAFIQKRNERERQRVKCVNQGYAKLRDHLPPGGGAGEKRLSKVETLRAAIRYINYLQGLIDGTGKGKGAVQEVGQTAVGAGLRVETVGRDGGGGGESPGSTLYSSSSLSSSSSSSPGGESQSSGC